MEVPIPSSGAALSRAGFPALACLALDTAPDQVLWAGPDGVLLYANRSACSLLEYPQEQLLSLRVSDICPELPPELWAEQWLQLKAAGHLVQQVNQRTRSGRTLLLEVSSSYLQHEGEEYCCAFGREIADRTRVERDLTEAKHQLETIFDTMQAGIIMVSPQGIITFANQRMAGMFGYPLGELIGSTYPEHVHPVQRRTGDDRMRRLLSGEIDHVHHERRYLRGNGGDFWGHLSGRRLEDAEGNLISLVGVIADISEMKQVEDELKKREQQFTSLADNLPDVVSRIDRHHSHLYVNRQVTAVSGVSVADYLGKTDRELGMQLELVDLWEDAVNRVFETGEIVKFRFSFASAAGMKHFESRIVPEKGADGIVETALVISRDITDAVVSEEQLRESEKRYRNIIENMLDVYYRTDAEGRLTMTSPSGVTLLGYDSEDQILGVHIGESYFDPAEHDAFLHTLRLKGKVYGYELTLRHRDGSALPVATSSHLLFAPDGTFLGVEGICRDISQFRQAMDLLKASEDKFVRAFNHAPVLMSISCIDDGRYLEVNDRFSEISGFSREELLGRTSLEIGWITAAERERLIAVFTDEGRVSDLEITLTAKDGSPVQCLYSAEPITVAGEQQLLSIALDVSDRLLLQKEREKNQRMESLGILAGGIAHDFNNILTAILGNVSLARILIGEEHKAVQRLAACEKAAQRASELTQQLLTFSRGGEPVKRLVDPLKVIGEAVIFALQGANVKGVIKAENDLYRINADEGQLSQVFNNLLINAKQAMPEGGSVTVTAKKHKVHCGDRLPLNNGAYVRVDVADQGSGIPPEQLGKIFDPYYTTKPSGTGLGLTTVYSIINRHGGHISVTSEPGQGAVFSLFLPAVETAAEPHGRLPMTRGELSGVGRILLMDDEQMIRELARCMLEEAGYQVVDCEDGAAAVEQYGLALDEGARFDAVILDLTIPGGVGGREAAALIGKIDPKAVLIVSSGYSNDPIMADYGRYGFSGSAVKPYTFEGLLTELSQAMEQAGRA